MKKHIILFLVRWYETFDRPLPKWLERACDNDTALGLDLDEEREFTRELKQKPDWNPVEPNPFLTERIIACLDDDNEEPSVASKSVWREVSIGIAACVAVAIAYQWYGNESEPGDAFIVENELIENATDANAGVERLANKSEWKNPLDQEIEYVLGDAKGAIDFLADSFLPSSILKSERKG